MPSYRQTPIKTGRLSDQLAASIWKDYARDVMTHSAPQNTELSNGFEKKKSETESATSTLADAGLADNKSADEKPAEFGGRGGLDPTRYGDWEKNGRCIDF
jgi:hypothetical protein